MKPNGDSMYDEDIQQDEGSVVCEECGEVVELDAITMCKVCYRNVCDWCWGEHMDGHAEGR